VAELEDPTFHKIGRGVSYVFIYFAVTAITAIVLGIGVIVFLIWLFARGLAPVRGGD
jgi:hypothetical protein